MLRAIWISALCFSCGLSAAAEPVAKPAISTRKRVEDARRLYAGGHYNEAARLYEGISANAPEYLRTREELAWAYMRASNWQRLHGIVSDLNTKLVPLRWRLEGRVLSSMLALKNCQYELAKNEISAFQAEMVPFAQTVDHKISTSRHAEYWKGLRAEVSEAVLKMKFVRLELRSRLLMLTRAQDVEFHAPAESKNAIASDAQTYPAGRDVWIDEVFHKQGANTSLCAAIHKTKAVE